VKRAKVWFILSILLLVGHYSFGQLGIRKGIKFGSNWSTFTGDSLEGIGYLQSFIGGANFEFLLANQWSIQMDVLYSPQGISSQDSGDLRITYISIPIVVKKQFLPYGVHPFICAGIEFNYLLSAKRNGNSVKGKINPQTLTLVVGGGLEFTLLNLSTYIDGRYMFGIDAVYQVDQPESPYNYRNRIIQVSAGILF